MDDREKWLENQRQQAGAVYESLLVIDKKIFDAQRFLDAERGSFLGRKLSNHIRSLEKRKRVLQERMKAYQEVLKHGR